MVNSLENKSTNWLRKLRKICLGCFLIILVFAVFLLFYYLIIRFFTGGRLQNFMPSYSDEIDYFMEINTAVKRGLFDAHSGYSGNYTGEYAVAKFLNYGNHGIFVLIPYYLVGIVFGWNYFSPIIANSVILTASFFCFFFITKNIRKTLVSMVFTLTFIPLILYFGTIMVEITFFAFSVILAALFYNYKKNPSRKNEIIYIIVVSFACLMRITNLVFFIPVIIDNSKSIKSFIIYTFSAVGLSGLLFMISNLFTAVYPVGFLNLLINSVKSGNIIESARIFAYHFVNTSLLFVNPFKEHIILVLMRYFMITFCLISLFEAFYTFDFKRFRCEKREKINKTHLSFSLVTGSMILLTCLFYEVSDWKDFRVFAPILLFVSLGAQLRYRKALLSTALSIAVSFIFLLNIGLLKEHAVHYNNTSPVRDIARHVKYNPDGDRWENTVIANAFVLNYDPGINVLYLRSYTVNNLKSDISKIKTKYIFLDCFEELEGYYLVDEEDGYYLYAADAVE